MRWLVITLAIGLAATVPALAEQPVRVDSAQLTSTATQMDQQSSRFQSFPRLAIDEPVSVSEFTANQEPVTASEPGASLGSARVEFVVKDGMVFVQIPGVDVDLPMSGGGASGCFDADGVQRGYSQNDLIRMMTPLPPAQVSK